MDNAWLWLYLFTRLDALHLLFTATVVLGAFGVALGCIGKGIDDAPGRFFASHLRNSAVTIFISTIFLVAVPTKSDMALILGGHFGLQAATSEPMTETADKVYRLIQKELDARLADEPDSGE